MAFTLVGYSQSVDQATLANLNALADQHVRVSGADIIIPRGMNRIVAVYPIGVNLTRAQLVSPSIRRVFQQELAPGDRSVLPTTPTVLHDYRLSPIELDEDEALNAQGAEDAVGASRMSVFAWLADGAIAPVGGDIRTVRLTGTTTLVTYSWTNVALTLDQSLPAGRYAVVGGRCRSANILAWRLVFVGGTWRPGAIGSTTFQQSTTGVFRRGGFGVWGEFNHNLPPSVDIIADVADTAETLELDLIKVG